jgi:hypothetical protein
MELSGELHTSAVLMPAKKPSGLLKERLGAAQGGLDDSKKY